MEGSPLVLYGGPRFVDHESRMNWFGSKNGDAALYGEPLFPTGDDQSYDDTYYLTYAEDVDDNSSRSWYTNGETDSQDYNSIGTFWNGDCCSSYFRGLWGEENEVYADKGYGHYGSSSLEKEESATPVYGGGNNDMQPENEYMRAWAGYDDCRNPDHPYNSIWDEWKDTVLYERIFGQ